MRPRLWFMGAGPFGAMCLERLIAKMSFELIITSEPTRGGRGMKEVPSCVESAASAAGLTVRRTGKLYADEELCAKMENDPPDAVIIADFGQLIREPFLSGPRRGCINIHPSLLPRWRGAAPIQRALMSGDSASGVSIFRLVKELDAGPLLDQRRIELSPADTASSLFPRFASMGCEMIAEALSQLGGGSANLTEQSDDGATYADKIAREEFEISFGMNATDALNIIRGLDASGGAFVKLSGGKRLKIWKAMPCGAECAEAGTIAALDGGVPAVCFSGGALLFEEVQPEGKKRIGGAEWARGARLRQGDAL